MIGHICFKRTIWSALLLFAALCSAFALRMPPHSFLNSPVSNTTELVEEAKKDEFVMDRYMRHFAMTHEQLAKFLTTLHVGRLKETKLYPVYFAREGGYLDMRPQLLKAGRKVFMNASEDPILVLSCGNPMIAPKNIPASMIKVGPIDSDVNELAYIPTELQSEVLESASYFEPGVLPLPEVAAIPSPPIEIIGASPQVIPFINQGVGALAFLPLLALGHGGGSTPPVVPEPASFAALAIGLVGIAFLRKRIG